jgi:hypothetical protein
LCTCLLATVLATGSDGAIDKDGSYVEQVVAMETKAKQLGMGGRLRYLFPSGGHTDQSPSLAYAQFLSPHDLDKAVKAVQSGLVNAEQMIDSIHLGHHPYVFSIRFCVFSYLSVASVSIVSSSPVKKGAIHGAAFTTDGSMQLAATTGEGVPVDWLATCSNSCNKSPKA